MSDLWELVWGKPAIDARQLAAAIEREVARGELDFRTRLLIRDGAQALEDYWGRERQEGWLRHSGVGASLMAIRSEALGPAGFPYIRERLMERTEPDTVRQLLRDLGGRIHHEVDVVIGGSVALILQDYLSRATQDIDLVDEVPSEIRQEHTLLEQLRQRYGLALTHFQSHFLPSGWESRLHTLGSFGRMRVAVVDMHDLFMSKLFSPRDKDLDDLRMLWPQADRAIVERRLRECCAGLLADPALRAHAERNWYVLTGDPLPAAPDGGDA